jgi:hypothetical protein
MYLQLRLVAGDGLGTSDVIARSSPFFVLPATVTHALRQRTLSKAQQQQVSTRHLSSPRCNMLTTYHGHMAASFDAFLTASSQASLNLSQTQSFDLHSPRLLSRLDSSAHVIPGQLCIDGRLGMIVTGSYDTDCLEFTHLLLCFCIPVASAMQQVENIQPLYLKRIRRNFIQYTTGNESSSSFDVFFRNHQVGRHMSCFRLS